MENTFDQILTVMREFLNNTLKPQQFVDQYFSLWQTIRDQQHDALDNQTAVREKLQQFRKDVLAEEITSDAYQLEVQKLYETVQDISVKPGSERAKILSDLFVEVDAYEDDPRDREPYQIDGETLRDEVDQAFKSLTSS